MLLQLARRRDLSNADGDAVIKLITNPVFVSSAFGIGAAVAIHTCWRTVMNSLRARALLRHLVG
jgi:hypothetical protein